MAQFNINEEDVQKEKLLQELYELTDEYNLFVVKLDKRLDKVISKMECLNEGENIC